MYRLTVNKWSALNVKRLFARSSTTSATQVNQEISLPSYADVVVIGGGSAGCNALYYLGKRGVNAVLLEKSKLTSGTTWHTAGLIWSMRGANDLEMELLKTTRQVLWSLEEETGVNPGWINNGGLYVAATEERLAEYKRLLTISKVFGIEAQLLDNHETKEKFPLLDDNVFKAAVYCPGDGVVDPAMLINALTKSAKNNGCKIIEDCPVTKIHTKHYSSGYKEISSVETPYGTIKTNVVLNASGAWSKNIANALGLDIPLQPMKHAYIVSEPMEGVHGLPNVRDADNSTYFRIQGESICIGGYENNPVPLESAPKDFSFSLYELDWNVFSKHMENMIKLIPKLSTTGIKSTVCGPESFTPDHKPIMGEDPRCKGFYYSCGYNSAGMMLGGGCGEQIVSWIMNGRPNRHMFSYDIRRFIPEQKFNSTWINERCHEAYAKNYDTVFPHEEPMSGRNLKTDVFHDLLLDAGAVMEERQGWERPGCFLKDKKIKAMPYDYDGSYDIPKNKNDEYREFVKRENSFNYSPYHDMIGKEALCCRKTAALFNMSYFGKFYLCGKNAQEAMDYLCISNTKQNASKVMYTCMLNNNGGVEADCTVTAIESGSSGLIDPIFKGEAFYIVAGGMSAYQTYSHIYKVLMEKNFNATIHDVTESIGVLSIQGPKSKEILQTLLDEEISNETFPFLTARLTQIKDELVRILRVSFVGELGFEIHIPKHSCEKIYKAVIDAGKMYDMCLGGYRALYSLSCEKGYHLWNADLRIDDNPVEAGLKFLCRNNGEYLGKTIVDQLRTNGIKRKRVHFHVESDVPLWGFETVYRNDCLVGYIRRAEYGYTVGKNIGQAYVTHPDGHNVTNGYLKEGSYEIEIMRRRYPAKMYIQSPFDPENKRMLGYYDN